MTSVCLPQNSFQQQHNHHFQLMNGNIMLLQQQHQQQQQQQQTQFGNMKHHHSATTKILTTSNLHNIQQQTTGSSLGPMMSKKKYTYTNLPYGGDQLPSVARRNARERNRVKQVNNGFANLRQHIPQTVINSLSNGGRGASKKLSKVDTLRIAVEYIRGLQDLLDDAQMTKSLQHISDELSDDGSSSNYGYSSIGSPTIENQLSQQHQHQQQQNQHHHHHHHHNYQHHLQTAHSYNSEASTSPTPSFTDSEISIGGTNYLQPIKIETEQQQQQQQQRQQQQQQQTATMHFKFEAFENYSQLTNDEQPDDEELLDYISSWQEQ